MFTRIFLLALITISASQIPSAPTAILEGAVSESDLETAKRLLSELEELTYREVEAAKQTISDMSETMGQTLFDINQQANADIDEKYVNLSSELDEIKNEANANGKDISKCLEKEDDLQAVLGQYKEDIDISSIKAIGESSIILTVALLNVTDPYDLIKVVKQNLEQCRESDEKCIGSVIELINEDKKKIPQYLEDLIIGAESKLKLIPDAYQKEVGDIVSAYAKEGQELIDDIAACAKK